MKADARGLTTVEVLVAAGIVSVGLVALMGIVPISTYGLHEGRHLSAATFLAEQKLEEVHGARWSATPAVDCLGLSVGDAPPTSIACAQSNPAACRPGSACDVWPDETSIAGHAGYARRVRIADCGTGPGGCGGVVSPTLRRVTVTVTYRPLTGTATPGTAKSVVLVMTIARR